ncbi:MAG: hypothetical protein EA398_16960 [Deltaproteobacteria bacterium]|nr:MAG: hypothetical protein EA398_16960 [Deltaproteobacteria bacterium]
MRTGMVLVMAVCVGLWLGGCADDAADQAPGPGPGPGVESTAEVRPACQEDNDCPSMHLCAQQRCLRVCQAASDCAADERCHERSGLCRPLICEVDEDCPSFEVCAQGSCGLDPALPCRPGTIACDGTEVVTCSPTGERSARSCAPDGTCAVSGGVAVCVDFACEPGERTCLDWTVAGVCAADGAGVTEEPCGAGEYCSGGECRARVCEPGTAPRCEGGDVVVCDVRGSAERVLDICPGECSAGQCEDVPLGDGCEEGETLPCYGGTEPPSELGPCNLGERTCGADGVYGACEGWVPPSEERCVERDCPTGARERVLVAGVAPEVVSVLEAGGLTVRTVANASASDLADADIVVATAVQAIFDIGQLWSWVSVQGGVLVLAGTGSMAADCPLANPWLTALGVRFVCSARLSGSVSGLASHPLLSGLTGSAIPYGVGTRLDILEPSAWSVLYRVGESAAAVVSDERGCGQAVVLSHPEMVQPSSAPAAADFWSNFVEWVAR